MNLEEIKDELGKIKFETNRLNHNVFLEASGYYIAMLVTLSAPAQARGLIPWLAVDFVEQLMRSPNNKRAQLLIGIARTLEMLPNCNENN